MRISRRLVVSGLLALAGTAAVPAPAGAANDLHALVERWRRGEGAAVEAELGRVEPAPGPRCGARRGEGRPLAGCLGSGRSAPVHPEARDEIRRGPGSGSGWLALADEVLGRVADNRSGDAGGGTGSSPWPPSTRAATMGGAPGTCSTRRPSTSRATPKSSSRPGACTRRSAPASSRDSPSPSRRTCSLSPSGTSLEAERLYGGVLEAQPARRHRAAAPRPRAGAARSAAVGALRARAAPRLVPRSRLRCLAHLFLGALAENDGHRPMPSPPTEPQSPPAARRRWHRSPSRTCWSERGMRRRPVGGRGDPGHDRRAVRPGRRLVTLPGGRPGRGERRREPPRVAPSRSPPMIVAFLLAAVLVPRAPRLPSRGRGRPPRRLRDAGRRAGRRPHRRGLRGDRGRAAARDRARADRGRAARRHAGVRHEHERDRPEAGAPADRLRHVPLRPRARRPGAAPHVLARRPAEGAAHPRSRLGAPRPRRGAGRRPHVSPRRALHGSPPRPAPARPARRPRVHRRRGHHELGRRAQRPPRPPASPTPSSTRSGPGRPACARSWP